MTLLPINDASLRSADAQPRAVTEILSIATANPHYRVLQKEVLENAAALFPQFDRLHALYASTGIESRYLCEPMDWYRRSHTWEERTTVYQRHALDLLQLVALRACEQADISLSEVDTIVSNTITGLAIPSLDALLMGRLDFSPNVERLPIFGLGCGGGVAGLARAARLAEARQGSNVLFLTVDLCSLCVRPNDGSAAMFVSTALFGDGAAAVVLRSSAPRSKAAATQNGLPAVLAYGEHLWRDTRHMMGWEVKGDGFGIVLSPKLPSFLRTHLAQVTEGFLRRHGMPREEIKGFLLHPGGRKVLETAEEVLDIERVQLAHSWNVLRDFGNMSSATAIFILQNAIQSGAKGRHLLAAFGPGFSAYFVALDL